MINIHSPNGMVPLNGTINSINLTQSTESWFAVEMAVNLNLLLLEGKNLGGPKLNLGIRNHLPLPQEYL